MPGASCGLNTLAYAAAAFAPECSSMDPVIALAVSTGVDSSFQPGARPGANPSDAWSDGYESSGLSPHDEADLFSEALGPDTVNGHHDVHARDERPQEATADADCTKLTSVKRKRQIATIVDYDQEAWPVEESSRFKRPALKQEPQLVMETSALGKKSFAHGFHVGFLAGCNYIQTHKQHRHRSQMEILDNSSAEPRQAKAKSSLIRSPYRFCTKCWIMSNNWVLKSIKLPTGSVINLHPEVCPDWDKPDEEPTKAQLRVYGAAFKRAQRSSLLHDVALKAYKSVMPGVSESSLKMFLRGHRWGSN